jgi:hypothetical protein
MKIFFKGRMLFLIIIIVLSGLVLSVSTIPEMPETVKEVTPACFPDFRKIISSNLNKFEFSQFQNPAPFYRPGYFWSWNDTLTKELLSRQLNDMASHGAMSVCPLPIPAAFRPVNMPTLMTPDYLTPEYLEMFRYMTEKCRELNMIAYFYDEGGWPSGSCLGKVVSQNPDLVRQALTKQVLTPAKGSVIDVPAGALSAFLYQGETKIRQLIPGKKETINEDNVTIQIFTVKKNGQYPDLLNPRSTKEFISLTHDEYKKQIGSYFGSTLKIAFTDEPKIANPGWTDDLASDFMKKFGYDLRNELPSVFEGDSEHDRKVRIDYFNWWSQRFADAYFGQIQEWCHQNNLLSGGHLDGEDATVNTRTAGYGHPLRALRKMDVPAVDVIWRQLWPGTNNHHFPKFASTVAHQTGLPWAFTESFAVYGDGITASQMKWITDYQYVRGINLMVVGGYPLSKDDWLLGGLRPNFGPGNPVWKYMSLYHDYTGRLSYLLSLGKPGIKTALYYPVNDIWAGGSDLKSVCSSNDVMAKYLLENLCDFDLIDDDILGSDSTRTIDGQLSAGPMNYEAICVSGNRYMPEKSISKLEQFINTGGKVLWVDDIPGGKRPKGVIYTTLSELAAHLDPTATLITQNKNVRVCKRLVEKGSIYFVTNEDTCENSFTLEFFEDMPLVQLDPETGKCWYPSKAVRKPESWEIPLNLKFAGSSVFIFTDEVLPNTTEPPKPGKILQAISDGWSGLKKTSYVIGAHNIEIKEFPEKQSVKTAPGDWRQIMGDSFSGDVEYNVNFVCTDAVINSAHILDLGDVRYFCDVTLNGQILGKRIWQPFGFDITGKLRRGNNTLKVTVTNTLANQYTSTKALDVWTKNQLGPYHARTLAFEKESVSSGLIGPVTIR